MDLTPVAAACTPEHRRTGGSDGGSRGLLEEVARGQRRPVRGDLVAHRPAGLPGQRVDSARVGFEGLNPIVEQKNPQLAKTLTNGFALQKLLDAQKTDDRFVSYDELSQTRPSSSRTP
jgi:iron uptake system component EfeO